jgi:hypothetical protein
MHARCRLRAKDYSAACKQVPCYLQDTTRIPVCQPRMAGLARVDPVTWSVRLGRVVK